MRRFAVPAVCAVAMVAAVPGAARAHGPCGCLEPSEGPPGTRVRADYPIYKVVFNPDRSDLAIGPRELWRLHRGGPPVTVFRQTWRYSRRPPNRGGSFVIPRAEPGAYLVALYDGGESGMHYSWETFTVTRATAQPVPRDAAGGGGIPPWVLAGSVAVALALGFGAAWSMRLRGLEPPRA